MKRIRFFMILFFVGLSIPLGYFIFRTHQSLNQEERSELRYFADTLFYEMEKELSELVQKEEGRPIEDYTTASELALLPDKNYILGYFQNNPDGSFETPLSEGMAVKETKNRLQDAEAAEAVISRLADVNQVFNTRRIDISEPAEIPVPEKILVEKEEPFSLAGRYLDLSRSQKKKAFLGQEEKRVENITADQAQKLSKQEATAPAPSYAFHQRTRDAETSRQDVAEELREKGISGLSAIEKPDSETKNNSWLETTDEMPLPAATALRENAGDLPADRDVNQSVFRVEVDPLQSVFVSDTEIVFFRRIVIDNQVYRQGFVLLVKAFLDHMAETHFINQPMSDFAGLSLSVQNRGILQTVIRTGAASSNPKFSLNHVFPRPFSFLSARLVSDNIPRSPGRQTLNIMMAIMAFVILIGLFAIYRSVYVIVGLSERRSQFVSSVTHELKTPLTNIRMYIEMLEQGIASSPEREQEYFRILGSESSRLSRLINNVLEYSKLEKKNRRMEMRTGHFDDVIAEVNSIMREKIRQEGFVFQVENKADKPFLYDREVMVQVLINLIENSMKFSKTSAEKKIVLSVEPVNGEVKISLADTGPGIPRHALKKIFEDFFRVDNELTRTTGGTGIGLALVSKFVKAMGGRVEAKNNPGPGCTISVYLPLIKD